MAHLLRDLRDALRTARRQPGVTLVIILTLAVGIGANTAIFIYLLEEHGQQVRVPDAERLFFVRTGTREKPEGRASYLDALIYREAIADLGELSPWGWFGAVIAAPGRGDAPGKNIYNVGSAVSPPHFELFDAGRGGGRRFPLGRDFLPEEHRPDGPAVVVVDHYFWSRHLGGDREALGRTLRVNGMAFTIVGVTPRGFDNTGLPTAVYIPAARLDDVVSQPLLADRDARRFACLLRLKVGEQGLAAARAAAEARLAVVAESLDREHPWPEGRERHITLQGVNEWDHGTANTGEMLMAGAVGLLLVLACANVANLLLVRALGRQREIAVLAALGASRRRIAARLLTESVLLGIAGGVLGLAFARWITAVIQTFYAAQSVGYGHFWEGNEWVRYDDRVLIFTLLASVASSCLFGLAPILQAARTDIVTALKSGAGGAKPGRRLGTRHLLVVAQVTLATVLLLGAALLMRSLAGLSDRDPGFNADRQLLAALMATTPRMDSAAARREAQRRLYELGRRRLAELPGVERATLVSWVPGSGDEIGDFARAVLPERPDDDVTVQQLAIGPDFFATLGLRPPRGRSFNDGDRAGGVGAAIVNQAFVRRFWPDVEPLGRELRLPDVEADVAGDRFVVVGVAPDFHHGSRRDEPGPLLYLPFSQYLRRALVTAVARAAGPPQAAMRDVRRTLAAVHPDLALTELATYERQIALDLRREGLYSTLAGISGLFGLALACLGIYSVMSCAVSYRRRELGIRMAVGATGRDLVRLVLSDASRLVVTGILLGVAAALALGRLLDSLLYGVAPHDPGTFLWLPLLLIVVGLAAAWLPAWRAGRVDPKVALQEE